MMNPVEKKKSFFENHPKVCYALYAVLLFAFNLFLRWKDRELRTNISSLLSIPLY